MGRFGVRVLSSFVRPICTPFVLLKHFTSLSEKYDRKPLTVPKNDVSMFIFEIKNNIGIIFHRSYRETALPLSINHQKTRPAMYTELRLILIFNQSFFRISPSQYID